MLGSIHSPAPEEVRDSGMLMFMRKVEEHMGVMIHPGSRAATKEAHDAFASMEGVLPPPAECQADVVRIQIPEAV